MEELYTEILYNVIHFTGNDINKSQPGFLKYLQEAFGVNFTNQERHLEEVRTKEEPSKYLHVNVIEANVWKPTDVNGLSDPFCVLFLASKDTERFNTSIQFETLNPTWNESFELSVDKPEEDVLCLEVWDYDEEQTVGEKVKKIKKIKTVHGLKVYFKEVSLTVSPTKKRNSSFSGFNQLIGSTLIPLKDVPGSGETYTHRLDKNGKDKKKGDLKVHMSFCVKKDTTAGYEQHRHLLHKVILHELKTWKGEEYQWRGEMSPLATSLLIHHQEQCNISSLHAELAEWIEFTNVHEHRPLNLCIFLPMIEKLVQPLEENLFSNEEKKLFWEAATKLLPSCLMAVRRVQMLSLSDKTVNQPLVIFKLLCQMIGLVKSSYNWLTIYEKPNNYNINTKVEDAISKGAEEWFSQLIAKNSLDTSGDEEEQLNCIINVVESIIISLEKTLACYEGTFKECFHFSYAEILYKIYERNIANFAEQIVISICKSLKPLKFNDNSEGGVYDNDPLTVGSALFIVYTNIRKFVKLGTDIFNGNADLFLHDKFYQWFHPALVQWLYISEYKTKHRIKKAVELDHYDNSSQLGSSAVDVLGICEEIKIFWKELAWPETQTSYVLLTRIIEDTCECLNFYSVQMLEKSRQLMRGGENQCNNGTELQKTIEWCSTVKSIRHIQTLLPYFIKDFKTDEVITSAAQAQSSLAAEDWTCSINTVINKCSEGFSAKTTDIMETFTHKLMIKVGSLFLNAVEFQTSRHTEELMNYVDEQLHLLHTHLDQVDFNEILRIVWRNLSRIMYVVTDGNLNMKKEPSFYTSIQDNGRRLLEYFTQLPVCTDLEMVDYVKMVQLLELNATPAQELIYRFHMEQLARQRIKEKPKYGLLTVKLRFLENILRIEVLNARDLVPICPKGACDPYVKISLLPEEKFIDMTPLKTNIKNGTTYPLFDEQFLMNLSKEQRNTKNGFVKFTIKHNVHLRSDYFLGEAIIPFQDIPVFVINKGFENLDQIHLTLLRPSVQDFEVHKVLKNKEDKVAKDFIAMQMSMYP